MYVIHDGGVAPHCTITLKKFLKLTTIQNRRVGHSAPNACTTISTDLNLAGFHFCSHLKNTVNVMMVNDVEAI